MRKEIGDTLQIIFQVCGKCYSKKPDDYVIATGKNFSVDTL